MEEILIRVVDGNLKVCKLVPLVEDSVKKIQKVEVNREVKQPRKRQGRQKFDESIQKILEQYYRTESVSQIRQRIRDETGKDVLASSLYNWKYNKEKKAKATKPQLIAETILKPKKKIVGAVYEQ